MSISRVQEVELAPLQKSAWLRGRIKRLGLHSAYVSGEDDIPLGMLASLTRVCWAAQASDRNGEGKPVHVYRLCSRSRAAG